ncbi:MAG: hypothetical protein FJX76_17405 [Armatimonadetes bacterium]|nr:hypothetical protein [Armatimonadota bacterium]
MHCHAVVGSAPLLYGVRLLGFFAASLLLPLAVLAAICGIALVLASAFVCSLVTLALGLVIMIPCLRVSNGLLRALRRVPRGTFHFCGKTATMLAAPDDCLPRALAVLLLGLAGASMALAGTVMWTMTAPQDMLMTTVAFLFYEGMSVLYCVKMIQWLKG